MLKKATTKGGHNVKATTTRGALRVKSDDSGGTTIEGYASAFWVLDAHGDVVVPGAYSKSIAERFSRGLIKVLWQHDPERPIGVPTKLAEDERGLYFEARLAKTALCEEAAELMRAGVVDRFSIGYETVRSRKASAKEIGLQVDRDVNLLEEIKLFEFSPVTFAANEEAVLLAAKRRGIWLPSRKLLAPGSFAELALQSGTFVVRVVELAVEGDFEIVDEEVLALLGVPSITATAEAPVARVVVVEDDGSGNWTDTGREFAIPVAALVEVEESTEEPPTQSQPIATGTPAEGASSAPGEPAKGAEGEVDARVAEALAEALSLAEEVFGALRLPAKAAAGPATDSIRSTVDEALRMVDEEGATADPAIVEIARRISAGDELQADAVDTAARLLASGAANPDAETSIPEGLAGALLGGAEGRLWLLLAFASSSTATSSEPTKRKLSSPVYGTVAVGSRVAVRIRSVDIAGTVTEIREDGEVMRDDLDELLRVALWDSGPYRASSIYPIVVVSTDSGRELAVPTAEFGVWLVGGEKGAPAAFGHKAGRVLAARNLSRLEQARDLVDEVLAEEKARREVDAGDETEEKSASAGSSLALTAEKNTATILSTLRDFARELRA